MWVKYSLFLAKSLFFLFKFPILFVKSRIWPVKSQSAASLSWSFRNFGQALDVQKQENGQEFSGEVKGGIPP